MRSSGSRAPRRSGVIIFTIVIALLLNLTPYPDWMENARPDWVTLVLFYWCLALPNRVGVGWGWVVGIILDVLYYSILGQHAIGKAFVALIAVIAHRRMRMYHLWQQCVVVFLVSCADIACTLWIYRITNNTGIELVYWTSALTTALLWPVIYTILRFVRQRIGVS
ncbi:MAG: rod shape-determining protein MreD [Gammaproteobacteria bacterium]|nr:rod shape-determining protein MreD [Gammaproteobacteria bacterium]NKB65354.1 rod shape-determining protein MreD [Gammaproteobacteria bacterium]